MISLLRKVSKPKWSIPSWVTGSDLPADILSDLRTENNGLSVWLVEDNNVDPIVAAVASNLDRLDKFDYLLFQDALLEELSIRRVKSDGQTAHASANLKFHSDLLELTVRDLANLAGRMISLEKTRVPQRKVEEILKKALEKGDLDPKQMKAKLLEELGYHSSQTS